MTLQILPTLRHSLRQEGGYLQSHYEPFIDRIEANGFFSDERLDNNLAEILNDYEYLQQAFDEAYTSEPEVNPIELMNCMVQQTLIDDAACGEHVSDDYRTILLMCLGQILHNPDNN